jgi:hypothetical protein
MNLKKVSLNLSFSSTNEKKDESSTLGLRSYEYLTVHDAIISATALILSLPLITGLLFLLLTFI